MPILARIQSSVRSRLQFTDVDSQDHVRLVVKTSALLAHQYMLATTSAPHYFPPMSPADEFNPLSHRLTTSQGVYSGIVQVASKRRRVRRDACQFCAFRCRMSVWRTLAT